ncbi:MAG TPA: hypothetical protein VMU73_04290 [Gaiellaceae bacterium]|nr:hypothetical protein [Gaiellaceae bacterium]
MSKSRTPEQQRHLIAVVNDVRTAAGLAPATLRAAAGKRHSAEDQQHLDQAAGHLAQAGAHLPDDADAPPSANASAEERYKAMRTREMVQLRAATKQIEADLAAHPPTMRTLETPDTLEVLDGYRVAKEAGDEARYRGEPSDDPRYQPYGRPANAYNIAIALQRARAELAAPAVAAAARPEPKTIYTNGIPDGYATAIAKIKEAR